MGTNKCTNLIKNATNCAIGVPKSKSINLNEGIIEKLIFLLQLFRMTQYF